MAPPDAEPLPDPTPAPAKPTPAKPVSELDFEKELPVLYGMLLKMPEDQRIAAEKLLRQYPLYVLEELQTWITKTASAGYVGEMMVQKLLGSPNDLRARLDSYVSLPTAPGDSENPFALQQGDNPYSGAVASLNSDMYGGFLVADDSDGGDGGSSGGGDGRDASDAPAGAGEGTVDESGATVIDWVEIELAPDAYIVQYQTQTGNYWKDSPIADDNELVFAAAGSNMGVYKDDGTARYSYYALEGTIADFGSLHPVSDRYVAWAVSESRLFVAEQAASVYTGFKQNGSDVFSRYIKNILNIQFYLGGPDYAGYDNYMSHGGGAQLPLAFIDGVIVNADLRILDPATANQDEKKRPELGPGGFFYVSSGKYLFATLETGLISYSGGTTARARNNPLYRVWRPIGDQYVAIGFEDPAKRYYDSDLYMARVLNFTLSL
jgi:hypothetical protein